MRCRLRQAGVQAGALDYVTKDSPRVELVKAVNNVIGGRLYVSTALAESLVSEPKGDIGQPLHQHLSYRELELMYLLKGKTMSEIAGLLELSEKTVSTYRVRLLEKMRYMKTNARSYATPSATNWATFPAGSRSAPPGASATLNPFLWSILRRPRQAR